MYSCVYSWKASAIRWEWSDHDLLNQSCVQRKASFRSGENYSVSCFSPSSISRRWFGKRGSPRRRWMAQILIPVASPLYPLADYYQSFSLKLVVLRGNTNTRRSSKKISRRKQAFGKFSAHGEGEGCRYSRLLAIETIDSMRLLKFAWTLRACINRIRRILRTRDNYAAKVNQRSVIQRAGIQREKQPRLLVVHREW